MHRSVLAGAVICTPRFASKRASLLSLCLSALLASPALSQTEGTPAPDGQFKFETKVNAVLVPVLVRDRQGRALGNLTKDNFRIFDRGKLQVISGFSVQARAKENVAMTTASGASAESAGTDRKTAEEIAPRRFIAFLFDDLHMDAGDLMRLRPAAAGALRSSLEPADVAAVLSISGQTNTGFTPDHAKLDDAIMKLQRNTNYTSTPGCPHLDHYQAYLIHDMNDPTALEAAIDQVLRCSPFVDRKTAERMATMAAVSELGIGEQGTQVTLDVMRQVVLQMANLPGQRTLIVISSGFIALTQAAMREQARVMDAAAQAGVTINALDDRALYTNMLDMRQNMETPREEQVRKESLNVYGAALGELASGVGGVYFHNSNDLEGGLKRLTLAPDYLYLLQFSPNDVKSDGTFHRLAVKVDIEKVNVQARAGYFAERPIKTKKAHKRQEPEG